MPARKLGTKLLLATFFVFAIPKWQQTFSRINAAVQNKKGGGIQSRRGGAYHDPKWNTIALGVPNQSPRKPTYGSLLAQGPWWFLRIVTPFSPPPPFLVNSHKKKLRRKRTKTERDWGKDLYVFFHPQRKHDIQEGRERPSSFRYNGRSG